MMTYDDLDLEDEGYRDGRLDRPPAHSSPYYQWGYQMGTTDRLQHGEWLDRFWQAFQSAKLAAAAKSAR